MAPFSVKVNCEGLGYGLFVNTKLLYQHKATDCKVESCVVIRSWKVNIDISMGEPCHEEISPDRVRGKGGHRRPCFKILFTQATNAKDGWLDHLEGYPKVVSMNAVLISLLHVIPSCRFPGKIFT